MLSKPQIRYLKAQAHHLQPVVMIGANGVTEGVHKELDNALTAHELIKVRLGNIEDEAQEQMITHITQQHNADFIQKIGHTAVFFRRNPDKPKITLPKS